MIIIYMLLGVLISLVIMYIKEIKNRNDYLFAQNQMLVHEYTELHRKYTDLEIALSDYYEKVGDNNE